MRHPPFNHPPPPSVVPISPSKPKGARNSEPCSSDVVIAQPVLPLTPPDTPSEFPPQFPKDVETLPRRVTEPAVTRVTRMTSKVRLSKFRRGSPLDYLHRTRVVALGLPDCTIVIIPSDVQWTACPRAPQWLAVRLARLGPPSLWPPTQRCNAAITNTPPFAVFALPSDHISPPPSSRVFSPPRALYVLWNNDRVRGRTEPPTTPLG